MINLHMPYNLITTYKYYHKFHKQSNISLAQINKLSLNAVQYCNNQKYNDDEPYKYFYSTNQSEPVIYSSIYAVLIKYLVGESQKMESSLKKEWANYINDFQSADGLYRDPLLSNDIFEKEDWWGTRHLTLHAIMALNALDHKPRYPLNYIKDINTPKKINKFLDQLNWDSGVSFTSNKVQNYAMALQYARDFMGDKTLQPAINETIRYLTEKCSPKTGLWSCGISNNSIALSEEVQAAYHFWLIYFYEKSEIPYKEKALKSILALQNKIGGFNLMKYNSSACQDIDSIDPIIRLSIKCAKYREQTIPVIKKALKWNIYNFNNDGGASFQRDRSFLYGHKLMYSDKNESSLFATWFRLLIIAYCCEMLKYSENQFNEHNFNFLNCPGYQFI